MLSWFQGRRKTGLTKTHNILIACHRHIAKPNGGGEKSMWIIAQYLRSRGHNITAWVEHCRSEVVEGIQFTDAPLDQIVSYSDVVLTWGRPAKQVALSCRRKGKPYILCVRWWRNVVDVSGIIGDLSNRPIDKKFVHNNHFLFSDASAVITNNKYSADVIERFYGTPALVSFVPIPGQVNPVADKDGYILAISPNKGLDEINWLLRISSQLPQEERILVVNAAPEQLKRRANIATLPYQSNMDKIWRQCKMMIQPVYQNDICGTLRATIEAMRNGLPVIANDRCGMSEKIPQNNLVSYSADEFEWRNKIKEVNENWGVRSREAIEVFENYNTPEQLRVFEREVERAVKVKNYNP